MDDLLRRQMDKIVKEGYDRFTYAAAGKGATPTSWKFRYMPFRGQNVEDSEHVRLTEIQNTAVDAKLDALELGVPYMFEVDNTELASGDVKLEKLYQVFFHYTVENGKRVYKRTNPLVFREM